MRELRARRRRADVIRRRRRVAGTLVLTVLLAAGGGVLLLPGGSADEQPEPSRSSTVASRLDADRLAGLRLVAGYSGGKPPNGLEEMIRKGHVSGVIVFDGNVPSRDTLRDSMRKLQRIKRPRGMRDALITSVDQEGGLVKRLSGPPSASANEMGRRGPAYARKQGRRTAKNLRSVGLNVDLAPVLDVGRRGGAIDSEGRSFGGRPGRVIRVGVRGFADGLRSRGVAATAKHFPGLGAAATNTDDASQKITLSKKKLRKIDERPFEAFAKSDGELVMMSLATYPKLSDRPAAFSRSVAQGELRRRVGFEGVTITDSLSATAARRFGDLRKVAIAAAEGGSDLLLYPDWRDARKAGRVLTERIRKSDKRRRSYEIAGARILELRAGLRD